MRWEYGFTGIPLDAEQATKELNQLGQEGWEVIQIKWDDYVDGAVVVLKRPMLDSMVVQGPADTDLAKAIVWRGGYSKHDRQGEGNTH